METAAPSSTLDSLLHPKVISVNPLEYTVGTNPDLPDLKLLTVAEVARALRVSKMTIYRLIDAGELQAIRVGRSYRVPESAYRAYLDRCA